MRLFELSGSQFQDDLANLLKVMQGRADTKQASSIVSYPALNHMLMSKGYGDVNFNMLSKIKDQIDPSGELIQDITPKGVVLKTSVSSPEEPNPALGGPAARTVDQMANRVVSKEFGV